LGPVAAAAAPLLSLMLFLRASSAGSSEASVTISQDSQAYAGTSFALKGGRNNLYCGVGGDFVLRCDQRHREHSARVSVFSGPRGVLILGAGGKFCRDAEQGITCDLSDIDYANVSAAHAFRMDEVNVHRDDILDENALRFEREFARRNNDVHNYIALVGGRQGDVCTDSFMGIQCVSDAKMETGKDFGDFERFTVDSVSTADVGLMQRAMAAASRHEII
jgi:hypothetical protein